jgi:type IV secretory pathway VirB6-like protein
VCVLRVSVSVCVLRMSVDEQQTQQNKQLASPLHSTEGKMQSMHTQQQNTNEQLTQTKKQSKQGNPKVDHLHTYITSHAELDIHTHTHTPPPPQPL